MPKSLFVLLFATLTQSASAATIYELIDLGTLGGAASYGKGVNNKGNATGHSIDENGQTRAFFWSQATGMQNLGIFGSGMSQGFAISGSDNIVGGTGSFPFRWTPSTGMELIDSSGVAVDLNESNRAIGTRTLMSGSERTVLWSPTNVVTPAFALDNTSGVALNNSGEFVGTNDFDATGYFSVGNGSRTSLGSMIPEDLNDARRIGGSIESVASLLDFDTNTTITVGKLSVSDTLSKVLAVGEDGSAFGFSEGPGGRNAFVFDSSMGLQNINDLLPSEYSDWTILTIDGVSPNGMWAVGSGSINGFDHAMILRVQVPETFVQAPIDAVAAAYRIAGNQIAELCEASDDCEVAPTQPSKLSLTQADLKTVEEVSNRLERVIQRGGFSGDAQKRAHEALDMLRK